MKHLARDNIFAKVQISLLPEEVMLQSREQRQVVVRLVALFDWAYWWKALSAMIGARACCGCPIHEGDLSSTLQVVGLMQT